MTVHTVCTSRNPASEGSAICSSSASSAYQVERSLKKRRRKISPQDLKTLARLEICFYCHVGKTSGLKELPRPKMQCHDLRLLNYLTWISGEKDEQHCSLPPGSRDRTGRAVVEVHGEGPGWASHHVSVQSLCELLLYLHFIPRYPKQCPRGISQRPEMQNIFLVENSISLSHISMV